MTLAKEKNISAKRHQLFWQGFWILVSSIFFGFIYSWLDYKAKTTGADWEYFFELPHLIFFVIAIASLGIFSFMVEPIKILRKQKLRKQPSWVFYVYFGIFAAPIVGDLINNGIYNEISSISIFIDLTILLVALEMYLRIRPLSLLDLEKRFAAGSVGANDDGLGFFSSAINMHEGLSRLNDYVSVVGLYGGLGFGKSSYARMIIEKFDDDKMLYSYISLTETNEAKDFSKLFAERWFETLRGRYPKIDIDSYVPTMNSVLRENGHGFISDVLTIVSSLNPGLIKTRARFFDKFYESDKKIFTSDNVGKLFGNVPNIHEDVWIVMIDEIERASLDEIYRVVEIIERFKNEGRTGLPIKILFILCISYPDFRNFLEECAPRDPRGYLIKKFFFEDPKSITQIISLPPVDVQILRNYLIKEITILRNEENIKDGLDMSQIYPNVIGDPARSFIEKHSDALAYILGVLTSESPRMISRCITSAKFFYIAFRDRTGIQQGQAIRFSDILALEYLKLKYPFVIEFFLRTISLLTHQEDRNNFESYFAKRELKENKKNLFGWIEDVTGYKVSEHKKETIEKLVGLVAYRYLDFLRDEYNREDKDKYFKTTSYPEFLQDYLSSVSESVETSYRKFNQIYLQHKDSKDIITKIETEDLIGYSRFLFNLERGFDRSLYIQVGGEIAKRLLSGKIKIIPRDPGDTIFHEAIYQMVFQVTAVAEREPPDRTEASPEVKVAFQILSSILSSQRINSGAKYTILSSLANNERGTGSTIHFQLNTAFEIFKKYYEKEFLFLIKNVFSEARKRYLDGREIIYEKEENFFYLLYQSWSGFKDSVEELKKIRKAAARGLENYPDAINLYWSRYPFREGWQTLQDILRDDVFFPTRDNSGEFQITVKDLIAVTKKANIVDPEVIKKINFWSKLVAEPKYKEIIALKDDFGTLHAVLAKRDLIPHFEVVLEIETTLTHLTAEFINGGVAVIDKAYPILGNAVILFRKPILLNNDGTNSLNISIGHIDPTIVEMIADWFYNKLNVNAEKIKKIKIKNEDVDLTKIQIRKAFRGAMPRELK